MEAHRNKELITLYSGTLSYAVHFLVQNKSVQGRRLLSGYSKRPRPKRVKTCKAKARRYADQSSLATHQAYSQVFGHAKVSRDHSRKYLNLSQSQQAQFEKADKCSSKDKNFTAKAFER